MPSTSPQYELPKDIDRYLATVSKLYANDGKRELERLIVNAKVRLNEAWTTDNWNGGTYGHAVFLTVPESLYLAVARRKTAILREIRDDLNSVHNVANESVAEVFLEMASSEDADWRKESGLLVGANSAVPAAVIKRIWSSDGFRLFISHKSEVKKQTAAFAESIEEFGIIPFVAHKNIKPAKAWQNEIEHALASMGGFVALMTPKFHASKWTDQEVGYALSRGVPVVAVKLGLDPYGFIGKFQALSCAWEEAPVAVAGFLLEEGHILSHYIKAVTACGNWDQGNRLSKLLPRLPDLTDEQADTLLSAYNENGEVRHSFGFAGSHPNRFGDGLLYHLRRTNRRKYSENSSGAIKVGK